MKTEPTWIVTDAAGDILEASDAAARLLSVTPSHLRRRSLLIFFAADRPEWLRLLRQAAHGRVVERSGWIRPRDRRPRPVRVEVTAAQDHRLTRALVWHFSGAEPPSQADSGLRALYSFRR